MTLASLRRMAANLLLGAAIGLTLGGCSKNDSGGSPTNPTPPAPGQPVTYTAIGASDAMGIGASVPCLPLVACPDGTGYVQSVARQLAQGGSVVTTLNLGLPGAVLSPDIQAVGNAYGLGILANFLQQEMPFVARESTLVTIFAGGNDANTVATAVDRGAGPGNPNVYIDDQIRGFARDYVALVRGIRQRAPAARILVLNLPNFAGLPFTQGFSAARRQWVQRASVGFSTQGANALVGEGVDVIDLLCESRSYQAGNYSSDGFHPSDAGYAFMTGELMRAINGTPVPRPQASCPQMSIVP
jgi:lysophospholipase L1-like esterase